ncbi:MAG TPA: gluconate 2-dehydrogenase subunit 3 family protein [Bryobacteraceae bacterium]|jgi:hypothetical protein|nr:gluconate 2-dehydrogenase subunit 3 family protein [Bryobacteraceae bacterium]
MSSSRREFLGTLALWNQAVEAAAQNHQHSTPSPGTQVYVFQFLTPVERRALNSAAAIMIPATERSGGAAASPPDAYVDFVLAHARPDLQRRWREGLAIIAGWQPDTIEGHFRELAQHEFAPRTRNEEFFVLLKGAVTEAFYTSQEGIEKELGYAGLGTLRSFPGCTHDRHETPATYKPALRSRS